VSRANENSDDKSFLAPPVLCDDMLFEHKSQLVNADSSHDFPSSSVRSTVLKGDGLQGQYGIVQCALTGARTYDGWSTVHSPGLANSTTHLMRAYLQGLVIVNII